MLKLTIFVVIASLALSGCRSTIPIGQRPLRQGEAVALAEDFIRRNGYTDYRPTREEMDGPLEIFDPVVTADEALDRRHNTLESRAYGTDSNGRLGTNPGWTVVFRRSGRPPEVTDNELGRAVTMEIDGTGIEIAHMDYRLAAVTVRLDDSWW